MDKCVVVEYLEGSLSDGGAETLVKDYVQLLDKDKFEPIILVDWIFKDSANYKRLKDSKIKIISLYPSYSIFWRAVNKFFRKKYIDKKLQKVLKKIKPDVLHIHLAALNHVVKAKAVLKDVRLFYTCHSEPRAFFDEVEGEDQAAQTLLKENNLVFIALHQDMAKEIRERFNTNQVVVIRNGIDVDKFRFVKETKEEIRTQIGINQEAFVVGHVGRFVPEKNHKFLIEVFEEITKLEPNSVLLMIGTGEEEPLVRQGIQEKGLSEKVKILSNRTDIPQLLKAMDVFVFPSLFEGFGNVLVEAQASNLRCIVADNINREVFLSNLVIPTSLKDSPKVWAQRALDKTLLGNYSNRLEEYDIKKEIKNLEKLYLQEKK